MTSYDQQQARYARWVARGLTAPAALRPDGEGVGMTLAEAVVDLAVAVRENTVATRELLEYLRRRYEGE